MIPAKSYLISIDEGDLEALVTRCLDRAFKKSTTSVCSDSQKSDSDELLTSNETAKLLKVSKVTVWDWEKRGILKKHTIGNQVRYLKSEVIEAVIKKSVTSQRAATSNSSAA